MALVDELPQLFDAAVEAIQNESVEQACTFYNTFVEYAVNLGDNVTVRKVAAVG
jgi:hypothetical protein